MPTCQNGDDVPLNDLLERSIQLLPHDLPRLTVRFSNVRLFFSAINVVHRLSVLPPIESGVFCRKIKWFSDSAIGFR